MPVTGTYLNRLRDGVQEELKSKKSCGRASGYVRKQWILRARYTKSQVVKNIQSEEKKIADGKKRKRTKRWRSA